MVEREVLRAALLAYLEGLKPRERMAFVARFTRRLGMSKVRSLRAPAPGADVADWLTENLGDMLGGI